MVSGTLMKQRIWSAKSWSQQHIIKNNLDVLIEATNGITENTKKVSQGNLMAKRQGENLNKIN